MRYIIIVIIIFCVCYIQISCFQDKKISVRMYLEDGNVKTQVFTIPNYASLNLYKNKKNECLLQWRDNNGYYNTLYYGVEEFEIIE